MWQDFQKMCNIFCSQPFVNGLLLFLTVLSLFFDVQAQDTGNNMPEPPKQIHLSKAMVVVFLSIMFAITFLLLACVKFCGANPFELLNRDIHHQNFPGFGSRFSGIDKQVIEALPVFKFSSLKGSKEGLECVVCLSKFEDTEILRLLPKCRHAFHINCIDKWLEGHSSCPLCRNRVDPEDIKSFTSSISSRFLLLPSNLTEDANLEIFVQREQSRQGSSRFNIGSSFWNVDRGKKEELLIEKEDGRNWEDLHKFNHKIVVSNFVSRSRWSDLNSTDLLFLNSEMLNDMSSRRFRGSNLPSTSKLNPGEKRSVSEIAHVPRFAEISMQNRVKDLVAYGGNDEREERLWRIWLPIARRTVQWFTSARELEHQQLAPVP